MAHDPTSTNVSDWSYISEGGATIVFSYIGPSHPFFNHTVLRLRKIPLEEIDNATETGESEEPDDPSIEFQQRITSRLIPKQHLPRLESVPVSREWLTQLSLSAKDHRPESRKAKDDIDVSRRKAVLATDLVGGRGWAVEIKPKWAFLPNPSFLSEETKDTKLRNCRFCMHSRDKASAGKSAATGYCPLDLFSGDKERVAKAIASLWSSWIESNGHINNLKAFIEGGTIEPQEAPQKLAPLFHTSSLNLDDLFPIFTEKLLPLLLDTSLLSSIRNLQRTLDSLDVEGLSRLWAQHKQSLIIGSGASDPTMDEWASFTETYLTSHPSAPRSIDELTSISEERLRYYILAYLLSATFKDCSIILRLGSDVPDSITVIDLDPKGVERLRKWEAQDREIVLGFKEQVENGEVNIPPCVDAGRI